jgi:5'-nucleotidase / UDP-sugar diphosphatase
MWFTRTPQARRAGTHRSVLCILVALLLLAPLSPAALGAASDELTLTILHTNDEHSALIPHSPAVDHDPDNPNDPTRGGFARLATAIEEIRAQKARQNEPVLLFSAGDFLGETAFGWLAPAGHAAELSLMQTLGYDAVTIGNHEYDYGTEVLADYLTAAGYPAAHDETVVLASNTRPPAGHPLAERGLLRDTAVLTLDNGLAVGVFGLLGRDAEAVASDTGEIVFLDRHETAREMVAALRAAGADIIVALTHSGDQEDVELVRDVPGIDVIVGGHSHTVLHEPIIEGDTIIAQTGYSGIYLGQLELAYDPGTGKLRLRNRENNRPFLRPIDGTLPPNPAIARLVDEYTALLNDLLHEMSGGQSQGILDVVARAHFPLPNHPRLQESPIGNFITDGMRLITQQVTGERVDVAIQANGSIRGAIIPGTMPHATDAVSFYDIVNTIGLGYGADGYAGYPIVSVHLTGEELRRMLEVAALLADMLGDTFFLQFSGLRYDYNPDNVVLFTVPIMDQPLPSSRAVTRAELYTGAGYQPAEDDGQYRPIEKGDERLYHLVTDSYILSFLPMVGEMLPNLTIVPKDAGGQAVPIDELDRLIVHRPDGTQLKVWQTVVEYAAAQPPDQDGVPRIPAYYATTAGRINPVSSFPLIAAVCLLPALILLGLVAGTVVLVRRKKSRRTA